MSKEKPSTESADLEGKIKKWLQDSGYPLEMETARTLLVGQFGVRQGVFFDDPVTGKPRELDILAYKQTSQGYSLQINFLVECKYASKPLVLMGSPETARQNVWTPEISETLANLEGKQYIQHMKEAKRFRKMPLFNPTMQQSYSLLTALRKNSQGKDIGFSALNQIANLAFSYTRNFPKFGEVHHKDEYGAIHYRSEWIVPVVVVSHNLFRAFLGVNNEIVVQKADWGLVSWFVPTIGNVVIRVYEQSALPTFVEQVRRAIEYLDALAIDIRK